MSYGIEIYDSSGNRTLGMQDFTYNKIFELYIPAAGSDTSPYVVNVPGFVDSECVVLFTPATYTQGEQPGFLQGDSGIVPVYYSAGGTLVAVVRRALANYYDSSNQRFVDYYTTATPSIMHVYKFRGV